MEASTCRTWDARAAVTPSGAWPAWPTMPACTGRWVSDHIAWPADISSQYPYTDDGHFPGHST